MHRAIVFVIACIGLLCIYGYTLIWSIRYAMALPIPQQWRTLFPSWLSGTLTWIVLLHTLVVVVASVPFAILLARFGGRRAPAVALMMTMTLVAVLVLTQLTVGFGELSTTRMQIMTAIDATKLVVVLPALVWLIRKLPSNNRWSGP